MTKEQYEAWSAPFKRRTAGVRMLFLADKMITVLVFVSYPLLLLYLASVSNWKELSGCICIPAASFLLVSLFRRKYSAPRPYEALDIRPLIPKETKGRSFPSRHVFSVFMIGMTYLAVIGPFGLVIMALGVVMAFIRVIGGVHFPKDVAVGALSGIFFGLCYIILFGRLL